MVRDGCSLRAEVMQAEKLLVNRMSNALKKPIDHDWDELESLGSDQVYFLLRTLRLHKQLLEASHQDAMRLSMNETPPCYLVDYEELHRYMYAEDDPDDKIFVDLEYLFSRMDMKFIVGYGTALEVIHRIGLLTHVDVTSLPIEQLYFDTPSEGETLLEKLGLDPDVSLQSLIEKSPEHNKALRRLHALLIQENFADIAKIEKRLGTEINVIDTSSYDAARSVLASVRPDPRYEYPNIADAINFAAVIGLRKLSANKEFEYFPFLLTNTRPLLDEKNWANDPIVEISGLDVQVSRRPLTAVYSHIVSNTERDPAKAVERTSKLIFQTSVVELDLRLCRGYRTPVESPEDYEWEDIVALGQLAPTLREQIKTWSEFVSDPLISEVQRIYDNTRQAIAKLKEQKRLDPGEKLEQSPRKLFDIIIGISYVLKQTILSSRALALMWSTAIKVQVDKANSFEVRNYKDARLRGQPYIEIEKHHEGHFIFRWVTNLGIEKLLDAFVREFLRHDCDQVDLHVGTDVDIFTFTAKFPLSLDEILMEVSQPIYWLRMDGKEFDLYADVLTDPNLNPLVGVLIKTPNSDNLAEFYAATSGRFIFKSWLMKIFEDAGITVNS